MRLAVALPFIGLALAPGCNKGDSEGDTDDTSGEAEHHPLVPEKYRYLWNTGGCETTDGKSGVQVYILVDEGDGSADASGSLTATERWYWFYGGEWDEDCVDTFQLTGEFKVFDYTMLGCSECEEAYEVTRRLTEASCGLTYYHIFALEERPDEEAYQAMVLFDTLTPSGNPNVDNKMLVMNGSRTEGGAYAMDYDYARGHAFPDDEPGYPSAYDWVGDKCFGRGR